MLRKAIRAEHRHHNDNHTLKSGPALEAQLQFVTLQAMTLHGFCHVEAVFHPGEPMRLNSLKYKAARSIERHPFLSSFIYNNISRLKFLFPHEKDYHGIPAFCENSPRKCFVDIGANIGLSTVGFRALGFTNKIFMVEANPTLIPRLEAMALADRDLVVRATALGALDSEQTMHAPYYRGKSLHTFGTFNREELVVSLEKSFPDKHHLVQIKSFPVRIARFDDLGISDEIHFVKIDAEGFEYSILQGMKETVKRWHPVFLIEYNRMQFGDIADFFGPDYRMFLYDPKNNAVVETTLAEVERRAKVEDGLSIRNVFFAPVGRTPRALTASPRLW